MTSTESETGTYLEFGFVMQRSVNSIGRHYQYGPAYSEGTTPSITGESFELAVDSQTTITGISVVWNGAVVNVTSPMATTEDFNITGSIPTSKFQVDVTVQASQNASTGAHPVTLDGVSIETSDGDGSGNSATEDFDVEVLAVGISGRRM